MPDPLATSMQQILSAMWQRHLPQVVERLHILDRAAASQELTPQLHEEAASIAHKLAGSLGMFGFPEGTRIARELEQELRSSHPRQLRLQDLTQQLRLSIFPGEP